MRKSSRGNPYHDERGRFCSKDKVKITSERTQEEYDRRTKERQQQEVVFSFGGNRCHALIREEPPVNGAEIGEYERNGKTYTVYKDRTQSGAYSYVAVEKDYRISHRPQGLIDVENGEADLATDISVISMPGYYEHPEYYPSYQDEKVDKETYEVLKRIRNNPEAELMVYRGSPKGELNEGDWVTLSPTYADMYAGEGPYAAEGSKVYSYKVKAKELVFPGDSVAEFGYWGNKVNGESK